MFKSEKPSFLHMVYMLLMESISFSFTRSIESVLTTLIRSWSLIAMMRFGLVGVRLMFGFGCSALVSGITFLVALELNKGKVI